MRKMSEKYYISTGFVVIKGKTLLNACAAQEDILDFVRTNNIKIPRKAWYMTIEGVTSIETRPVYGLDSRVYKGYVNYSEEKE